MGSPSTDQRARRQLAPWALEIAAPPSESPPARTLARIGGVTAVVALVAYLTWRLAFTLPAGGWNRTVAFTLIGFEALPVFGLVIKAVTLWSIDCTIPAPIRPGTKTPKVAIFIPTYNEPAEVILPTIAAACAIEPAHETWVLDDGDRPWVAEMCRDLGARYVRRTEHQHAKAGNMNHALALLADEGERGDLEPTEIVAVLDCDHVPMPGFLTNTLGWFDDPAIALVQGPQHFYNHGAFDDDGHTGEQGLFFNVLMAARQRAGVGPFWCGSTSLIRVAALDEVGGVATETITEDMHTTLKLVRAGWKTAYHRQTIAVGLAPATPDQYLLQRRRWGMGAMQILVTERLWAAKRWMSWRNYWEYLDGTLFWLEGLATLGAFCVPIAVMMSGARTSTATPLAFASAFFAMFAARLWGAKRLLRGHIRWKTAFALRTLRIPVGVACAWWLLTRDSLEFVVTPKGGADSRRIGRAPLIIPVLASLAFAICAYAAAGVAGWVPWRTSMESTVASGLWLALAGAVLLFGMARIRAERFATSRRRAHRFAVDAAIRMDGVYGEVIDVSTNGIAARFPVGTTMSTGLATIELPGCAPLKMEQVRSSAAAAEFGLISLQVCEGDWTSHAALSLWLFQTPPGAVASVPDGVPIVALTGRA